jgi:endonuclease/exonuclease/phosphatase family metal-dependent hydrolase
MFIVAFWINFCSRGLFLRLVLLFSILHFSFFISSAQRTSVAFWNVENLFDTIPSAFYDDAEFTPEGARKWNTERYDAKIKNLARVIDDMAADVVGLAEVENEAVLRDLVMAVKTDYNYIHRTSGDSRGIDVALLYKGDKFFPDPGGVRLVRAGTFREFLHVEGELSGERIHFVVCHMASNLNRNYSRVQHMGHLRRLLESLLSADPAANVVVMGDMNAVPGERLVRKIMGGVSSQWDFVSTPHWKHYRAGRGSYSYRGKWYLYDWMMVSPSLAREAGMKVTDAGIFAKEYLTEPAGTEPAAPRKPLRTFYGGQYLGGYSDHFPVWMVIGK